MQRATKAALVKAAKRSKRLNQPLFVFSVHRAGRPTRFISTGDGNLEDPMAKDTYLMVGLVYPEGTFSLMDA